MSHRARIGLRWLLILFSVLGLVAFAVTSIAVTSSPVPHSFDGWAAVFVRDLKSTSRLYLSLTPMTPGGYGAHPVVQYNVAACGTKPFNGLLVLAGGARLEVPPTQIRGTTSDKNSVAPVPGVTALSIYDSATGASTSARAVQVMRISLPRSPCRFKYEPDSDAPPFFGSAVALRGPLNGQLVHQSFAPFGLWPARQAQSWPLLGRAPAFAATDLGLFRLSSGLGQWSRPFQSYFGVDVGSLDAKAVVDFARPQASAGEALSWTASTPLAAKARVVNSDNLGRWQIMALAAGIWLGIGGSVLASMAFEAVRTPGSAPSLDAAERSPSLSAGNSPVERGSSLFWTGIVLLSLLASRRRWPPAD
jgi:hypothetical protein